MGNRAQTDPFFDRDWSRIRGGVPRARAKHMTRAAMGHTPAIFKAIRDGGTHTRAQLRNQLEYLTTKSTHIIDGRGTYDGKATLTDKEIEQISRRFSARWNEGFHPKLGHTAHLLMAFPIGTDGNHVADITRDICERFFQGEGSHFDYIAAVHQDRDHPHAHIVLNRRSMDGEFFYLKEGHHFNYDRFREAMVDIGAQYGLRLEATRRVERGVTDRAPSDLQVRGVETRSRPDPDPSRHLAAVAQNARIYHGLAAEASRQNYHDIAQALDRAGAILEQGGVITADGKVYGMSQEQMSFDQVVDAFHDKIKQAEDFVATAEPERRVRLEHELNDIYRSLSHLSPLGAQSHTLLEPPSDHGIYAAQNRLSGDVHSDAIDRLSQTFNGTGIAVRDVIHRMTLGAYNAALERNWMAQDLQAIADHDGLDLTKRDDMARAVDRLDQVYAKVSEVLKDAEYTVIRDSDLPQTAHAVLARLRQDPASDTIQNDQDRETFRDEMAALLGPDQLRDLSIGDDDALAGHVQDRLDRLYLTKAYLQTDPITAQSPAMEHVLDEIANEEIDQRRHRENDIHDHRGPIHG